jgi:anti-anti-sigma factor
MRRFPQTPGPGSVEVRRVADVIVVALRGDHDLSTKRHVAGALAGVRQGSPVVVDLTFCTFVDSTVIGVFLDAGPTGSQPARALSIVLPNDTSYVYRALAVVGVRDLIPLHDSLEAALGIASGDPMGG